jgi:DEAD/DEAH box helicase domain-containing protein
MDFEDQAERGPLLPPPQLTVVDHAAPTKVGNLEMRAIRQVPVVQFNDNDGQLFSMYRERDGSVVVPERRLYSPKVSLPTYDREPDLKAAIGSVKATDVLLLTIQNDTLAGPDGVVEAGRRLLPAGLSALWSFAELLRIASAAELDVNPAELQTGLHPISRGSSTSRSVFVADALENGAGYARRLGQPDIIENVLSRILDQIRPKLEARGHRAQCDASCPDCLRSYDNRQLHSVLDWRLALDLAEIAAGLEPDAERWLGEGPLVADRFVRAFGRTGIRLEARQLGTQSAVVAAERGRAAVLMHPLWRSEEPFWTEEQRRACDAASRELNLDAAHLRFFDLHSHLRHPHRTFVWIAEGETDQAAA